MSKIKAILRLLFIFFLTGVFSQSDRPNIILIMADDQGWGDVGYNGHPHLKTPHLDAMAQNGAVFSRFYSAGSVCSPTRASVMTGRHPARMGICSANCGHLRDQEISLAEMVKEKGYRTGHFGKWHLGTLTRDILDANRGAKKKTTSITPLLGNTVLTSVL